MRLRQVALVAKELEPVATDLAATLGIEVGFRDPGVEVFGLSNVVMPIGDTFLEVVSPREEGTTAGRLLSRRGGDGGYMLIVQTDALPAHRDRMKDLGVRIVWEVTLEDAAAIHLHPRDVGGAILSLDAMTPHESWRWAGPEWKSHVKTDLVQAIVGAEVEAEDPERMAARWSAVLGRPAKDDSIALDGGRIRFVEASDRGEGVAAIEVEARDPARILETARSRGLETGPDEVNICGTRILLR